MHAYILPYPLGLHTLHDHMCVQCTGVYVQCACVCTYVVYDEMYMYVYKYQQLGAYGMGVRKCYLIMIEIPYIAQQSLSCP